MPVKFTGTDEHAVEGGLAKFTVSFTDDAESAVTPDTMTYTVTDTDGNVQNSLEDEVISSLDTSVTVVLKGDDLGISATEKAAATETFVLRILTMEGTYTSDLGSDLPLRDQAQFMVDITTVDHDDT